MLCFCRAKARVGERGEGGGAVYDKKDGVHVFMVRNVIEINKIILPFYIKYPLVGTKSLEFEKFSNLIELILSGKHLGKNISNRDAFIEMALICKDLNDKMENPKKLTRLDFIINWLKTLNSVPSLTEKLDFKRRLAIELSLTHREGSV